MVWPTCGLIDRKSNIGKNFNLRSIKNFLIRRYPTYYNFALDKNVPNYQVPREGRSVRVTTTEGEPIIIGRKKIRSGQFRLQYKKITYHEQLVHAFGLFDDSIRLLEQVP